jgi:trigger factor
MAKKQINEKETSPQEKSEEIIDKPIDLEIASDERNPDPQPAQEDDKTLTHSWNLELKREKIEEQIETTLKGYVTQVRLPGFRQGKVPFDLVKSRFYEAAEDEVVNKMLEEAIMGHIRKENLNIIDSPAIEEIERPKGGPVTAKVTVELAPDVTLPDLAKLTCKLEKGGAGFEAFDEEKELDKVLEANKRRLPVIDREIKEGDFVVIKSQDKNLDSKRMTPKKESYFEVKADAEHEISGLYSELLGKKNGMKLTINREYPQDYSKAAWQGKHLEHQIEVFQHFEMKKPELDEGFVKKHGYESIDVFKSKLKEEYEAYQVKLLDEKKMDAIIQCLVNASEITVPKRLLNQELSRLLQNPARYSQDFNEYKGDKDAFFTRIKEDAERNVRFSFIMEKLISENKMDVTQDDLEAEYQKLAAANNIDSKQVKKYYQDPQQRDQLKDVLLKRKVLDFLKLSVKVEEV